MQNDWEGNVVWRPRDIVWSLLGGTILGAVVGALLVFGVAGGASSSDPIPLSIGTACIYGGQMFVAYQLILRRRQASLKDIGFVPVSWKTIALMVPAYFGLAIVLGIVLILTSPLLGEPTPATEQLALDDDVSLSGIETIVLLFDAAMVAPFVEELFFRGLIYRYLRKRWSIARAVVVSSLIFAVLHPFPPIMPAIFVIGVALALVVERYKSLYPSVVLHGLVNGAAILVLAVD